MKKRKIDSVIDFCQEVEEVNRLFENFFKKSTQMRDKIGKITDESWFTGRGVIFRKKVAIKTIFTVSLSNNERFEKIFVVSSFNISYVVENNFKKNETLGLVGVYLALNLKNKTGSRIDIGIAASKDCNTLPDVRFDELRLRAYWENCILKFNSLEDFKTVVTFCKKSIDAVNEKLANANLEKMTSVIHV